MRQAYRVLTRWALMAHASSRMQRSIISELKVGFIVSHSRPLRRYCAVNTSSSSCPEPHWLTVRYCPGSVWVNETCTALSKDVSDVLNTPRKLFQRQRAEKHHEQMASWNIKHHRISSRLDFFGDRLDFESELRRSRQRDSITSRHLTQRLFLMCAPVGPWYRSDNDLVTRYFVILISEQRIRGLGLHLERWLVKWNE